MFSPVSKKGHKTTLAALEKPTRRIFLYEVPLWPANVQTGSLDYNRDADAEMNEPAAESAGPLTYFILREMAFPAARPSGNVA